MDVITEINKFMKTKTGKSSNTYIMTGRPPAKFVNHVESMAKGFRSEVSNAAMRYWMSGSLEDIDEDNQSSIAFIAAILYEMERYRDIAKKMGIEKEVNALLKERT